MEAVLRLKILCAQCLEKPEMCFQNLRQIKELLHGVPPELLQRMQANVLCVGYPIFQSLSANRGTFKECERQLLVDVFKVVFDKTKVDKLALFFNIYGFLVMEIYDPVQHKVKNISEEYKLSIIKCVTSLSNSLSWDIITDLYVKENTPKLCHMLYVALELVKTERMRQLRISSMEFLNSLARVDDDSCSDLRSQIADVFMFFLPGIASALRDVSLEDEKSGHTVTAMALKTWGNIVALEMEDYNKLLKRDPFDLNLCLQNPIVKDCVQTKAKWKNADEIKSYINTSERNLQWYENTDKNLEKILAMFPKLAQHSHEKVRLQLAKTSILLIDKCISTAPRCVSRAVALLIALSQDENESVSKLSRRKLEALSAKFSTDNLQTVVEFLEENLYDLIKSLPRTFNRKDRNEQLNALNSLAGFLELFGPKELNHVLHSPSFLDQLLMTLLHVCEIEKTEVKLLEDYSGIELESAAEADNWLRFTFFDIADIIRNKIEKIVSLFAKFNVVDIVSDFLLDVYNNDFEHKCEATFILNHLFTDVDDISTCEHNLKTIINIYLEPNNWNLPLDAASENEITLKEARCNVLQTCLQVDGIGHFALALKTEFRQLLLKSLYPVLEKAGSPLPLVRLAGLKALNNVIKACNYSNVTELISLNSDYFSYHVMRKLKNTRYNEHVLNVLGVVLNYSTIDVMPSISDIINGILMESCDHFHEKYANAYLNIFKIFLQCLHRWLHITVDIQPIKSKQERAKEFQEFSISDVSSGNDFSDEIMGKTAGEMYREDLNKSEKDIEGELAGEDCGEYKKPEAPVNVQIVVAILRRSLHFLPSKDARRKLLVLEILKLGLEVVRDWEDELLPIVHQIWSPLVDRFKDLREPLIVNLSFHLLVVLARLSKDFIRSRCVKDVLPSLKNLLATTAKDSLLKDKGSSYRYTQSYKLQVNVLRDIGRVLIDLEVADMEILSVVDTVVPYLSVMQPLPLQEVCVGFFKQVIQYDADLLKPKVEEIEKKCDSNHDKNLRSVRKMLEENQ